MTTPFATWVTASVQKTLFTCGLSKPSSMAAMGSLHPRMTTPMTFGGSWDG